MYGQIVLPRSPKRIARKSARKAAKPHGIITSLVRKITRASPKIVRRRSLVRRSPVARRRSLVRRRSPVRALW